MTEPEPLLQDDNPNHPGIERAQLSELLGDVTALARAELEYIRLRAAYSGKLAKRISLHLVLFVLAATATMIAAVVGLLMVIAQVTGMIIATILVITLFGLAALAFAHFAKRNARKLVFDSDRDIAEND